MMGARDVGVGEGLVAHTHEGPGGGVRNGRGGRGIFVADDGVSPGGVEHGGASRHLRLGHGDFFLLQWGCWAYSSMVEQRTFNP